MLEPAIRLRRAIHLNDLILIKRIVRKNPRAIRNHDLRDRNNSSLHLVARAGHLEVAEYLIAAGHEEEGISRNVEGCTPLMEAVEAGQDAMAELLAMRFPRCIPWRNKDGVDALMLAARHGSANLVTSLLAISAAQPAGMASSMQGPLLEAHDLDGNTALHYAAAYGHLKCLRTLLQAGADPTVQNALGSTPITVSRTKESGQYFLSLVMEMEKRRGEERERDRELIKRREGGVRLVSTDTATDDITPSQHQPSQQQSSPPPQLQQQRRPSREALGAIVGGRSTPTGGRPSAWLLSARDRSQSS